MVIERTTNGDTVPLNAERAAALDVYLVELIHSWSRTLSALGFTLVPVFFILDSLMMPRALLPRFAVYRGVATAAVIVQYLLLRITKPSRWSVLHGYFITVMIGGTIALMTKDLGGFSSTYYAGLNLVIVAVPILLPWRLIHSAANAGLVIVMYVAANLIWPSPGDTDWHALINNLFFMMGTAVIAVSLSHVKHSLVVKEFLARLDLRAARDALWSEMEVAKRIQTALLPQIHRLENYEIAATMIPATEVGGDYYDVIRTQSGETWVCIGDVSGHGVESGLIMMMAQTSLAAVLNQTSGLAPSRLLAMVNIVLKENMTRLGADRYMTMTAVRLAAHQVVAAGKHQDLLVYRRKSQTVEAIETPGTWLGVVDDLRGSLDDVAVAMDDGDVLLLYTDGVTEAANKNGELFGDRRLKDCLARYADLEVGEIVRAIVHDVQTYMKEQTDDISLVVLRRRPQLAAHSG